MERILAGGSFTSQVRLPFSPPTTLTCREPALRQPRMRGLQNRTWVDPSPAIPRPQMKARPFGGPASVRTLKVARSSATKKTIAFA